MDNKFAKIISYLFHPIFLPVYCLLLLFSIRSSANFDFMLKAQLLLLAFVAVTTIMFPLLMIFLMKWQGFIKNYEMDSRQDRLLPYLITAIFYFLVFNMFRQMHLHSIYISYMLGASTILVLIVLINIRWKISTHMAGIGGVFGMVLGISVALSYDLQFMLIVVIALAGIVGLARLKLDAHKPIEIYTGFLLGAVVMTCIYLIPLYFFYTTG
jgi:hypothetical protein